MLTGMIYRRQDKLGGLTVPLMLVTVFGFWALRGAREASMGKYPGIASKSMGDLYGPFRAKVEALFEDMRGQGFDVEVRETYRDSVRQQFYKDAGWSSVSWGFHMAQNPDGSPGSLAVDVKPRGVSVLDESSERDTNKAAKFFTALMNTAPKYGLMTGGEFSKRGKWAKFDLGWDPGHIQYKNLTTTAARRGERP